MSRRLNATRRIMAERDIDHAIFTSYHNICYLAQFLYCKFGRKYAYIVNADSEQTELLASNIDGGHPYRKSPSNCKATVYTDWQKDNYFYAIEEALKRNSNRKSLKIGIEYDDMNLQLLQQIKDYFEPNGYKLEFTDIGVPQMELRIIKSEEEQKLIREGAAVADIGGYAVVDAIKNGADREYEVAIASTNRMIREIADRFGKDHNVDLMDTWTWFSSGLNTDGGHNPVTSKQLKSGDILSMNLFPIINGYYTALERSAFYEHIPSKRYEELWEINCKVHRRGCELIKPGAKCCDIANELNEMFMEHDLFQYRTFGYGHSFGVLSHYYGREAGLELREDNETVLTKGMVVSMEPCFTIPQGMDGAGGYREHDILIVTEDGADNITKFPFGPEHNVLQSK